ncbi:hypothetical protein EJ04DRAFT_515173 [Polyplosphaeria fusca]|uniref:Uncharacterized protein n=1 Tax=Polyplosphaeria fusca TaxID=682080 RepID=A0A9P4QT37_9PLEO|nr:hypothetical protein EJ04DRAFT_515173 [Polyplosphaeria fusca]
MARSIILTLLFSPATIFSAEILATDVNIGFQLNYGYGTAAVLHSNGTLLATTRANSTQSFRETFKKLSLSKNQHLAPPYDLPYERYADAARQRARASRKAAGLPASDDVEALSSLITELCRATERELGGDFNMTQAAAAVPRLPALYDEDLYDAFEYSGVEYLQIMNETQHKTYLTYESSAALVELDLAVQRSPFEEVGCDEEISVENIGEDVYYLVDFTRDSLAAYYTRARSAYVVMESANISFELGLSKSAETDSAFYWESVRAAMLDPLVYHISSKPGTIILTGDCATDAEFRKVLDSVVAQWWREEVQPEIIDEDAMFVQAKGVAEFVRRQNNGEREKPERPNLEGKAFDVQGQQRLGGISP